MRASRTPKHANSDACGNRRGKALRIYILTDMEGVCGVRDWSYAEGKHIAKGNRLLVGEVRAAIRGARAAGATNFTILEGHGTSSLKSLQSHDVNVIKMRAVRCPYGLNRSHHALLFIGQHAMAGTACGHLSHTNNGIVKRLRINGKTVGETGQWVMLAGTLGVPAIFLAGDEAACKEAEKMIPGIETASVKKGLDRKHAVHLTPAESQRRIQQGVRRAIEKLRAGLITPCRADAPFTYELELIPTRIARQTSEFADRQVKGLTKIGPALLRSEDQSLPRILRRMRHLKIWQTIEPA